MISRLHLDLAWMEYSGGGNTPALVGLRCKLSAFECRRWKWVDLEGRVPASAIARDIGAGNGSRVTNLFKGLALLPDAQLERFAECAGVTLAWLLTGTDEPAWLGPHTYQVIAHQAQQFWKQPLNQLNPPPEISAMLKTTLPIDVGRYLATKDMAAENARLISITMSASDWIDVRIRIKPLTVADEKRTKELIAKIKDSARTSARNPPSEVRGRSRRR